MDKKICLITGANSGIGKAASIQVARNGYHVIIACRNQTRGEAALKELKNISNNRSVELMIVDMSLQSSISEFVTDFLSKYDTLDVIIHNAADFKYNQKAYRFYRRRHRESLGNKLSGPGFYDRTSS